MVYPERAGEFIRCSADGQTYTAYFPKGLPPSPPLEMEKIYPLLDQAMLALGRLDALGIVLPEPALFPYLYLRKEFIVSAQIEGSKVSLSDLLLYESHASLDPPHPKVVAISTAIAALEYVLKRIQDGSPLSLRLMQEMHGILSQKHTNSTGDFRRSQNWMGGTGVNNAKFIPPPPEKITDLLNTLEKFLQTKTLPALIKAALAYYQFETIRPFADGNGCLSRLLISFILCAEGSLCTPMLYLSLYFKKHRQHCQDQMQRVRETGDWEAWIEFFLKAVTETSHKGLENAKMILNLFRADEQKIQTQAKVASSLLSVQHYLQHNPIVNAKKIAEDCKFSLLEANKALRHLVALGILKAISSKGRNKIYAYEKYLAILNQ